MVHGFVQQSHGRLNIESASGEGTQVPMVFRVAEPAANDDAPLAERRGGAPEEPRQRRCRILVVEDNDDVRELAENMPDMACYDVLSAPGGELTLGLLESGGRADLLFTDVIMPGGVKGLDRVGAALKRAA